ncbi:phage holin family protein [Tianweitania sediminis]|jgi:xanthine/uracil/vitamin C permease (AzgA family)|uniref:Phage holin family protein n=1 Tax=Tianweitania sediminis TaxID=1502156 RepID=A0A8J7QWB3_9HYPH|nr:phage holin family protein [Tianweitania sediminis]MBP0437132.1 phage holin family protein [Tianweitania sediminis]HEV7414860.1 phage holin family protein [Tianweitania sediminis]
MIEPQDNRGVGSLISDLIQQVSTLVQTEIRLLRSEMGDKMKLAVSGITEMLAGAILLMAALLVLLQALVVALSEFMDPAWASLLVGVVVAIIGVVLVRRGTANLEPSNLMPDQTTHQLGKDATVVKEQFK